MKCQNCHRKSELFLCDTCQDTLQELVDRLDTQELSHGKRVAGYIEWLEDAALGQTRLGESARRSTERNTPMPVNLTASKLLDDTHKILANWSAIVSTKTETLTDIPGKASA